MIWVQLTVAGIALGAIYALVGMGLVLTYKATGIFNFAYGGIAMLDAYIYWQLRARDHWPIVLAAAVALLIAGPGMGVVFERVVFRPLERRGASTSQKLVATLGVFELCLGLAFEIWTGTVRQGSTIVSSRSLNLGSGVTLGFDQLFVLVFTVAVCALLWLMFRATHLGTEIRAVVDRRELAELASVNANRVSSLSWALGCGLAGASGILLASGQPLDPYHFTLLVVEVFSIAVVARLVSLPIAVGAGVGLGIAQSLLTRVDLGHIPMTHIRLDASLAEILNDLKPYLSVVILFVALVVYRTLDEPGGEGGPSLISRAIGGRASRRRRYPWVQPVLLLAAAAALPYFLSDIDLPFAQITIALAVTFTSIVCVTGFSGQITLFQAVVAGLGGFVAARLNNSFGIPVIPAMLLGGLSALGLGVITGFPALRRRGLFLGLTTLAMGLLVHSFIFQNRTIAGGAQGIRSIRASLFGWSFDGDFAFYYFELVVAALMLLLARNLRSGRLGRILASIRDSETAARSIGVDLRAYKLFIFGASSFIAGIGGCLLTQQARIFNSVTSYDLFQSLLWFVAVIVAGVGSISGAILGAFVFELLGQLLHVNLLSQLFIALGALFIGYLPGGSLLGILQRIGGWLRTPRGLMRTFADAQRATPSPALRLSANGQDAREMPALAPSDFARRVLEETGRPAR